MLPVRLRHLRSRFGAQKLSIFRLPGEKGKNTPSFHFSSSFCVACHSRAPRSPLSLVSIATLNDSMSAADGKKRARHIVCLRWDATNTSTFEFEFDTDTSSAMAAIASAVAAALVETGGTGKPTVHSTVVQLIPAASAGAVRERVCDTKRSHTGTWLAGVQLPLRCGE